MSNKIYHVTKTGGRLNIPLKSTILRIYEKVETDDPDMQYYLDQHLGNGLELEKPKVADTVEPLKVGSK